MIVEPWRGRSRNPRALTDRRVLKWASGEPLLLDLSLEYRGSIPETELARINPDPATKKQK
jgi:hypothetical protein